MKILKNGAYTIPNDKKAILGIGSFGKVYKAYTKNKEKVAIKEITKSKLQEHPYIQEAFESEIQTQKKATMTNMPYFVKLIDHFTDKDHEYVVLEFCEGGTLTDYYKKNKLSHNQILEIIYQISIGIEYLHKIGITHRDIKLDNILKKDDHYKIADFGFATQKSVLLTCLGTNSYMSPELIREEQYDQRVDVWAVNTMLYKMLTKTFYFDGRTRSQLDNNIMMQKFKIPTKYKLWPTLIKDLLEKGYIKDFTKRPTMLEYIEHPAFDPIKSKHSKNFSYVSNINYKNSEKNNQFSQSLCDVLFQNLKIKLVNYINNVKNFFDLYVLLKEKDLTLAFASLKRYLQNMTLINIFFHNKKYIPIGYFCNSNIDNAKWESFFNNQQPRKFIIRIYYHIYIALIEYKNCWIILENRYRKHNKTNPLKIEVSQPIKNSFKTAITKMAKDLTKKTNNKLYETRKHIEIIIKLEQYPSLFFES